MRKLIAMVLLGAGAVVVSATAPAQAMTASGVGAAKLTEQAKSGVVEVRHRHWRRHHRHWRHRHWRRHHHRRWRYYSPYYYSPYYYGHRHRYWRRPRLGIYFSL